MYHIELRDFPHNMCRFNLTDAGLRAILEPWARGQEFEYGEQRWNPQRATLTILEGPEIPIGELKMGRGWGLAQGRCSDVTDALITSAREAFFAVGAGGGGSAPAPAGTARKPAPAPALQSAPAAGVPASDAFALGVRMAALLGPDALRLLDAWQAAATSSPGSAPSEALARAEEALRASA